MSEIIIYHAYHSPCQGEVWITSPKASRGGGFDNGKLLLYCSNFLAILGSILVFGTILPKISQAVRPNVNSSFESQVLSLNVINSQAVLPPFNPELAYQPDYDSSLLKTNTLKIASIGINTELQEAVMGNFEEALKKGVWRVSDFGTPYDRSKPTILAAHRYGYLAWTYSFRMKNSFYNLPKVAIGDTIEITWRGRRYIYEVYGESEGEKISDYSADLILYTCKSLDSTVKIFKYAKLLEI